MPVPDEEMGQSIEYKQLRKYPKYQNTWNASYSNEIGQLCQGLGKVTNKPHNQHVKGTDTFKVIHYTDIPVERLKEIIYIKVVCEVRPPKSDLHHTRITIGGKHISYPSGIITTMGSL